MQVDSTDGKSLRDWFAGMALQGMLANVLRMENMIRSGVGHDMAVKKTAEHAFEIADSMLTEREVNRE